MPSVHDPASPVTARVVLTLTSYVQSELRCTEAETVCPSPGVGMSTASTPHLSSTCTGRHAEPSVQLFESPVCVATDTVPEYVQSDSRRRLAWTVFPACSGGTGGRSAHPSYTVVSDGRHGVPSSHDALNGSGARTVSKRASHVQSSLRRTVASSRPRSGTAGGAGIDGCAPSTSTSLRRQDEPSVHDRE